METLEKNWKLYGKDFPQNFLQIFVLLNHQPITSMYHQLLIQAFEKAKEEIRTQADTPAAERLSDFIQEDSGQPYGERSLRTRYNQAREGTPFDLRNYVVESLAHYLEYENFQEFLKENPQEKEAKRRILFFPKFSKAYLGLALASIFVALVVLGWQYFNQTRWMIWNKDHYVETKFDEKRLQEGTLKLYKEDRIENFRKIDVNCQTQYKNPDGTARVWYGKNKAGQLQYFSTPGLHPETGKTLKELSKYMFDKHICPSTSN
ncbi:MAG: hypothetical protein WDZ45_11335 [Flavobacteriaceae bacterium]